MSSVSRTHVWKILPADVFISSKNMLESWELIPRSITTKIDVTLCALYVNIIIKIM